MKSNIDIKRQITKYYLEGKNQEEIVEKIAKDYPDRKTKKLKVLVCESEFLSPKSFRYGSLLMFVVAFAVPPVTIYLRGVSYHEILAETILISFIFALPFVVIGGVLIFLQNLRYIFAISTVFVFYLIFFNIFLLLIAIELGLWTMVLLPAVFIPTFIGEWLKLRNLLGVVDT